MTAEIPTVRPGKITPRPRAEAVVDAGWVQAHLKDKSLVIVDARTPEFHTGENAGGMPRAGHVPGARNVPFSSLLDASRKLKPTAELKSAMGGAGSVVTYCHIGMQATVPYFVARYLGMNAKLYDGSFQDWSSRTELPVESSRP